MSGESAAPSTPPGSWWRPRWPQGSLLRRTGVWIVALAAACVVAMTLMRAVPYDRVTPVAQLVTLTPWVAAAAVVILAFALLLRSWGLAAVTGVAVVAQAVWIAPFFIGGGGLTGDGARITVMTVNALYGRADASQIVDLVRQNDVDVLSVVELTPDLVTRLDEAGLHELLPSFVGAPAANRASGSGLWSSTELRDGVAGIGTTFDMPSAVVDVGGTDVRITAVHPVPPVRGDVDLWSHELAALANRAHADPAQQILLGDFNASYDHASFRAFLGGRFVDVTRAAGAGLNFSWPVDAQRVPTFVDLDHILVDESMTSGDVRSVRIDGTDHKALLATVEIRDDAGEVMN